MQPGGIKSADADDHNTSTQLKHKLHDLTAKTKFTSKHLLGISKGDAEVRNEHTRTAGEAAIDELNANPAFDPAKLFNKPRIGVVGKLGKTVNALQTAAQTVTNPKASLKSRVTRSTASNFAKNSPQLSQRANLDFLEAHADLHKAKASHENDCNAHGTDPTSADANVSRNEGRVEELQQRREAMRVGWVTDRHLRRVKVVDTRVPSMPEDSFFEDEDDCGYTGYDWGRWIAYVGAIHDSDALDIR